MKHLLDQQRANPREGSSRSRSRGRLIKARPRASILLLAAGEGAGGLGGAARPGGERCHRAYPGPRVRAAWSRRKYAPKSRFS